MDIGMFFIIGCVIYLVMAALGFMFVNNRNHETYIKFTAISLVVGLMLQTGVTYILNNPSAVTYYQGSIDRLWVDIRTRTETYQCGNSTCTRLVQEEHYMVDGVYANRSKGCQDELSYSDWLSLKEGQNYVCEVNEKNFMLFDDDKFKTTQSISKKYEKSPLIKQSAFFSGKWEKPSVDVFNYVHYDNNFINASNYQQKLIDFNFQKPYSVEVYITGDDKDIVSAVKQNRKGANVNQVLMFYGIDNLGVVKWADMITFADNEKNHKMVADFVSKYATEHGLMFKDIIDVDLDNLTKHYVQVNNEDFAYIQDNYKHKNALYVLIFSCFLQGLIIIIFSLRF